MDKEEILICKSFEIECPNNKPIRFERRRDCYHDHKTGLEWSLDNIDSELDWDDAISTCTVLGCGWRLPTIQELLTLVDYTKHNPATKMPGMKPRYYWSSNVDTHYMGYTWHVNFHKGGVSSHYKGIRHYVRYVRGTPHVPRT